MRTHPTQPRRAGFTLVELMVVVVILITITAIAIPLMTSPLEERQIREASRSITAFLHGARDRAIRNGRPVGVRIERLTVPDGATATNRVLPTAATTLTYVESPEPYSGDTINAVAFPWVRSMTSGGEVTMRVAFWPPIAPFIVRQGDLLQLNGQDRFYEVVGPLRTDTQSQKAQMIDVEKSSNTVTIESLPARPQSWWIEVRTVDEVFYAPSGNVLPASLPWPIWSGGNAPPTPPVPYTFHRKAQESAGNSLQLPESVVIDLAGSGFDTLSGSAEPGHEFHWENNIATVSRELPITIMFGANGEVERVYFPSRTQNPATNVATFSYGISPSANTCLLIGRIDHLFDTRDTTRIPNWLLPESLWVTVSPHGRIQSNPNHPQVNGSTNVVVQLRAARTYARGAQSIGGR